MPNATLGGLTFVGDETAATYTLFRDGGLTGWFEGVEMRREKIARPNGNGYFSTPGFLGGRLITLSGLILTADASAYELAMKALEDLLADGSTDTLAVEQETGTFTVEVGRDGEPQISHEVYGTRGRYRLQLWAPDPTKTGPI